MNWRKDLINLAANMSVYSNTPYPDALNMPISGIKDFFDSESFDTWKKARESEMKNQAGIASRLNGLIGALGRAR